MTDLLKAAFEYKQAGMSIVGITNNKRAFPWHWGKYQNEIISDEFLFRIFSNSNVMGIAIVCGNISGNLEVIDMDTKYDLSGTLFDRYCEQVYSNSPELYQKLPIAITKNKGYHFFYRCEEIGNYSALAKRLCTETEKLANPDEKIKVLIEIIAKGGYVVTHPTIGYSFIQHDLKKIPCISPSERLLLFTIARSFNEYYEPEPIIIHPRIHYYDPQSPFDDYNSRGDVLYALSDLLVRHGWIKVKTTSKRTYFRRPGNTDHDTSGDYNHQLGLFGVKSTNTDFQRDKGYKPHAVYAILECNGDFKLAAKRLLAEGYGVPYRDR